MDGEIFASEPVTAVEAIDRVLDAAASARASDVHVDPREGDVLVRFRIDGQVETVGILPKRLHEEMIARIKLLSGARTDIHAVPQDGRFMADLCGEHYNIRVSFMPTYRGENVVARLLPARSSDHSSFASLGFTPEHVSVITRAMKAQTGLILATGPTGSGKTTTLRVCMGLKAAEPISVMTLEDPVEYEVPGVRHVHTRRSHGVSFADGLRAALRQDPDVIMVGEIRDEETARTAVHTALTGNLVFSTMHTVSALETILRLRDMGIEPYLLAATIRLIIGQRLVRRICMECGGETSDRKVACVACRGSGYAGRTVIAEVCEADSGFRERVALGEPMPLLWEYAVSRGFRPMSDDAGEKIDWGMTTATEVMRAMSA